MQTYQIEKDFDLIFKNIKMSKYIVKVIIRDTLFSNHDEYFDEFIKSENFDVTELFDIECPRIRFDNARTCVNIIYMIKKCIKYNVKMKDVNIMKFFICENINKLKLNLNLNEDDFVKLLFESLNNDQKQSILNCAGFFDFDKFNLISKLYNKYTYECMHNACLGGRIQNVMHLINNKILPTYADIELLSRSDLAYCDAFFDIIIQNGMINFELLVIIVKYECVINLEIFQFTNWIELATICALYVFHGYEYMLNKHIDNYDLVKKLYTYNNITIDAIIEKNIDESSKKILMIYAYKKNKKNIRYI